jgi:hypothetical protein
MQGPGSPGYGSLKNWENKIWSWVARTQTRAGLLWREPTATINYRPVLSSERVLQNNKRANCIKIISRRKKNWSEVSDGCLTPRRTGRLTDCLIEYTFDFDFFLLMSAWKPNVCGVYLGYLVPMRNGYRNLDLQVRGTSYFRHLTLGPVKKTVLASSSSNCKLQAHIIVTHQQTYNCLKVINRKNIPGLRWVPDTKRDWRTDCLIEYNFGFDFELLVSGDRTALSVVPTE